MITQDKACIRVAGPDQSGCSLRIVSDRDCRIWTSQLIQVEGCHVVHPTTKQDTGLDAYVIASYTLDLVARQPAILHLGSGIMPDGPYQNVASLPRDGALLLSSGDAWPGYEPQWVLRMQPHG